MNEFWKNILNQKFFIIYDDYNVQIYEILPKSQTKLLKKFVTETAITSIQFNRLVPNIIILSFVNGICKIYNILNKNDKEDILYENENKDYIIKTSLFNIFDPNIIATISRNAICIWDIRKLYYLNILKLENEIINVKWSYCDKNYLEMKYKKDDKIKIKLLDVNKKNVISSREIPDKLVNFLYLQKNILILIKKNLIEKINFENNNDSEKTEKLFIDSIIKSNEDLIQGNNILSIISLEKIYFIDILKFSIIQEIKFPIHFNHFFYVKSENEIGLKYSDFLETIDENIFILNNHKLKQNNIKDLDNIKDNFYDRFCPKLLKYMCLLNFKDNETEEQIKAKYYMNIQEIKYFFGKVKNINIFKRKDFITQLFDYNLKNNQIINLDEELNVAKFQKIRKYIDIFKNKDIKERKDIFISKIKAELIGNLIEEFYIEIIKLLTIDNTNVKLLEIYLLFLNLYEKNLIFKYNENNIEKYDSELEYYSVCFSKEEYKILFNKDKKSEKELLFNFLDDAYKLKNFDFSDVDFKKFIQKFKKKLKDFPDFNQPIEYDCSNDELKWHSIKEHIFITFLNIEISKKNKNELQLIRIGLKTVIEKKLFKNENIINDKYRLQSVVYLITNPFYHDYKDDSLDFFCNSILSESNNIDELKKNYKIIDDNKLEYENELYDNIKDICIKNLSNKNYSKQEKYNFNFLMKNYISNQDKIYQFLLRILNKKVFKEAYKILFEDEEYKLSDELYLKEFIEKRLNFVPIKPNGAGAISDKYSLNTFISTKKHDIIINNSNKIESENLKEILYTSNYILTEEHEIFHILNCIPYYENNCSVSIDTPRKNKYSYNGKGEGGIYLELLLFNKEILKITLSDALFILNEDNYDKSLPEFIECFKKKKKNDLIIKGVFSYFNNYFELSEISNDDLENNLIKLKTNKNSDILSDYYIVKELKDDVAGKLYKK